MTKTGSRFQSHRSSWILKAAGLVVFASPAMAQDEAPGSSPEIAENASGALSDFEFDGLFELGAVASDLNFDEGEGIDTSGMGARFRLGAEYSPNPKTGIRAEAEGRFFNFQANDRNNLETGIVRLQITHQASDDLQLLGYIRRFENIAVLETLQADQTSVGAQLQWSRGNDRLRVNGEYRSREYDTVAPAKGDGFRVGAQYNRRLGSYHWFRLEVRHEGMDSAAAPQRAYTRQIASIKYSLPLAKRVQLKPSLEYRQWKYDARIAQGDPEGNLRKDSYIAPGIELTWGRSSRGPYVTASAEYRFRASNDTRFDDDAIRVGVRAGYRF